MASGDIRKWFMKQPAKAAPASTPDAKNVEDKNAAKERYNSTSKFFSGSTPANEVNEESKAKSSAASSKRFKDAVDVIFDDDEFEKPLPKKARNVGETAEDESGEKKALPGKGRGRGRGESNAKGAQDMDIDSSPAKIPAAGRGAGRGRGRGDAKAKGMQDMDTDASSSKPAAGGRGRGRGRGRGDASVAAASTEEDPEPSPKKRPAQADSKPAPAARGRGGGGGGGRVGGFNFGARDAPPHKGEKEVPEGAEDALAGLTFVISGTLDSLEREEAEHLIKTHGGRVTGSVSKKTDYLLADEDIGGRKSQKAKELGVKFLTEDDLFDKIRKTKPKQSSAPPQAPLKTEPVKAIEVVTTPKAKTDGVKKGKGKIENGSSSLVNKNRTDASETESWPHKHQPQSVDEIVGNQSIAKQVQDWLLQWEKHPGNAANGKKGNSSSAQKKAVLLSGNPGMGKTTTARLVCQLLGYEALEVNASDSRGKSDSKVTAGIGGKTSNTIKEMISNKSLAFDGKTDRKAVLIMDEVDGMSGGDRGGIADLIASIKSSHIPIICICNDKYSQKLKSLLNYCLPLPFRKPTKQQMAKRLQQIAKKEGLEIDALALEELSERVNGDMRMALNQLQYMSLRSRTLKYADVRTRLVASAKDEDVSPFSAVDNLLGFNGGRMRMDERVDAAMSDMDLVPLLIQENYLNYCPSNSGRDDGGTARMDAIARTALSIAEGDIVNVQIRRFRQWQHAQMGAFMTSIIPAAYMHGRREVLVQGERNFNRFGGWLGKNSTFGKKTRLLEDVHVHLLASRLCEPTREAVRSDYLPLLSMRLTQPLHNLPKDEAVQQVVDVLEEYSLDQEDMDTIVDLSVLKGGEGLLEGVPAATKTALTKTYKQRLGDRRVRSADLLPVVSLPGFKKASKKPARMNFMPAEDEENVESLEDSVEAEDEEEDNAEDEDLEGKALALLTESRPGMTLTLDPAKTKAAVAGRGRGGGSGRGRGRERDSSQPKTPKTTSSAKRK